MAVSRDIFRSWLRPRKVLRELLDLGMRNDRALAFLMAACLLMFISNLPLISRQVAGVDLPAGAPEQSLTERGGYAFFGWLIVWPLLLYIIAGLVHVIARGLGGKGSLYSARLAVFWGLLAATPAALFYGLTIGLLGPGPAATAAGLLWCGGLLWLVGSGLIEAETRPEGAARREGAAP